MQVWKDEGPSNNEQIVCEIDSGSRGIYDYEDPQPLRLAIGNYKHNMEYLSMRELGAYQYEGTDMWTKRGTSV